MTWALVNSNAVGFTDITSGGHVYTVPSGAAGATDLDILLVNSDTVINTPTGFTKRVDGTNNQGAYIFSNYGSTGSTIAIVGTPNSNTTLVWARFSGSLAYSSGNFARVDASNGTSLPALSSGVLAASNMLVVAYAALHGASGSGLATSPAWSNGFTALGSGSSGAAGSGTACTGIGGYKFGAGTTAETINSVTWTNVMADRYALYAAFTVAPDPVAPTIVVPPGAVHRSRSW